jgi:hypothetical protein
VSLRRMPWNQISTTTQPKNVLDCTIFLGVTPCILLKTHRCFGAVPPSSLAHLSAVKMEAKRSSEASVNCIRMCSRRQYSS